MAAYSLLAMGEGQRPAGLIQVQMPRARFSDHNNGTNNAPDNYVVAHGRISLSQWKNYPLPEENDLMTKVQ